MAKDITREPYRDAPTSGAAQSRTLDRDKRRGVGAVGAYLDEAGDVVANTGNERGPYVIALKEAPALEIATDLPVAATPTPGILIVSTQPGELHEAWAIDTRDLNDPANTKRWLMLFDRTDAPVAGNQPQVQAQIVTPLPMCALASYDFIEAPLFFATGIVIAISSTPLSFTPLAAMTTNYGITARFLRTGE